MIVTALTVTRGDRPHFLELQNKMLESQTCEKFYHVLIDYKPKTKFNDVTERYKKGFEQAFNELKSDLVVVMEDDDYYAPTYIENMVKLWMVNGRPNCFGFDSTWYYHLERKEYDKLYHPGRASMFNSVFTAEVLNCDFGKMTDPFLDIRLWKQLKGIATPYRNVECIGIKHGQGMTSGAGHKKTFKYKFQDIGGNWLKHQTKGFYETHYSNTPV